MNPLKDVELFHQTFNHPILESPQIPDEKRCKLRTGLIREELKELEEAIVKGDIVEVADALCDLQYVLSGAVLEFGLKDKFPALFAEVQRSNMSKACPTREEAEATVEANGKPEDYRISEKDSKFLVNRNSDDKLIKSVGYSPADLKTIIESPDKLTGRYYSIDFKEFSGRKLLINQSSRGFSVIERIGMVYSLDIKGE